jgi:hypothetical protein
LGCAWTLGIHFGKSCGLLDDHEKAPVISGQSYLMNRPGERPHGLLG